MISLCDATNFPVKQPTWSLHTPDSSKAHNHVIVRGRVIEISDGSSDMEIVTPSPTPGIGAKKGQMPTAGEGSTNAIVSTNAIMSTNTIVPTNAIVSTAGEGSGSLKGNMFYAFCFLN